MITPQKHKPTVQSKNWKKKKIPHISSYQFQNSESKCSLSDNNHGISSCSFLNFAKKIRNLHLYTTLEIYLFIILVLISSPLSISFYHQYGERIFPGNMLILLWSFLLWNFLNFDSKVAVNNSWFEIFVCFFVKCLWFK